MRFALRAKLLGFTLRDIQDILAHADKGDSPCPLVRNLIVQRVKEVREQLHVEQALFDRMERALQQWQAIPDQVPCGDSICHLIERLDLGDADDADREKAATSSAQKPVEITVENGVYSPSRIRIRRNEPVVLCFLRRDPSPCAEMVIFDSSEELPVNHPKVMRLAVSKPGTCAFTCQMKMYQGELVVEES